MHTCACPLPEYVGHVLKLGHPVFLEVKEREAAEVLFACMTGVQLTKLLQHCAPHSDFLWSVFKVWDGLAPVQAHPNED